jgi:hypothetical protein
MSKSISKFLDIDKWLYKTKQRIYRIGIELEGGWNKVPDGTQVIRDGSVHFEARLPLEKETRYRQLQSIINGGMGGSREEHKEFQALNTERQKTMPALVGEIPSMPLICDPKQRGESLYWEKWLKQFFPSHFNPSCGMHVHMSMRTVLTYQRLMAEEYPLTVIEYLGRWAKRVNLPSDNPLWDRLAGKSEYCQHKFYANEQARQAQKDYDKKRVGHRYTFIHYPFQRNGTVECRGLPMFEFDLARLAIQELLDITNAFLVATAKKEETFKAQLQLEDDHFQEDMIISI